MRIKRSLVLIIIFISFSLNAQENLHIKIGTYENPPKIFTDAKGNISGFWADISNYIAEKENWKIERVHGNWNQCLLRLESDEIDMMVDARVTPGREKIEIFPLWIKILIIFILSLAVIFFTLSSFLKYRVNQRTILLQQDITKRKMTEKALKQSEIKFRTLVEQLPSVTYTAALDESRTVLYISPQIEKLLGITPEEYKASPNYWLKHLHKEDRDQVLKKLNITHKSSQPFISEYRMILSDNRIVWIRDEAVIINDDLGNPQYLQGVILNITERKDTEEEIQRHIKEMATIYDTARKLQNLHTPETLGKELISIMEHNLSYEFGAILLIDESTNMLYPFALSDQGQGQEFIKLDKEYVSNQHITVGQGITGWVAQTGQSILLNDVQSDSRYNAIRKDICSELCVPLQAENQVIGVLNIETTKPHAYTPSDQQVLETLASQIALAIQQSYLYERIQHHTEELEQYVAERTVELKEKNKELERFNNLFIDREFRIKELKERIKELEGGNSQH